MIIHNRKNVFVVAACLYAIMFFFITGCQKKLYSTQGPVQDSLVVGAYYFDGWTGKTFHLSVALRDSFPERKPIWGWVTSTPEIIEEQIDLAANAGISFFNFCWYYSKTIDPVNQALGLYLKASNKNRLQFSLLVANHEGYIIGPAEWPAAIKQWIDLFKDPAYLKVPDRPYLTFFSVKTLVQSFGSAEAVNNAFKELRSMASQAGLKGVTIAAAIAPGKSKIAEAKACGFDVLTSYNDHTAGFKKNAEEVSIEKMITSNIRVWDQFKNASLPYVPTATLGWDIRPWSHIPSPRYTGYSESSVYQSVVSVRNWIQKNPKTIPGKAVAMLYAWNEYGEGAWLTPSVMLKDSLLNGVKKALKE